MLGGGGKFGIDDAFLGGRGLITALSTTAPNPPRVVLGGGCKLGIDDAIFGGIGFVGVFGAGLLGSGGCAFFGSLSGTGGDP